MSGLDALRQLVSRHAHNSHGPSAIEGLTITATDAPTSPRPGVAEPSLGLVIQGRKRTASGDRSVAGRDRPPKPVSASRRPGGPRRQARGVVKMLGAW